PKGLLERLPEELLERLPDQLWSKATGSSTVGLRATLGSKIDCVRSVQFRFGGQAKVLACRPAGACRTWLVRTRGCHLAFQSTLSSCRRCAILMPLADTWFHSVGAFGLEVQYKVCRVLFCYF
ncbi:unnamed protein product, partial [Ectocarpus sp. 12 AP-2014]